MDRFETFHYRDLLVGGRYNDIIVSETVQMAHHRHGLLPEACAVVVITRVQSRELPEVIYV